MRRAPIIITATIAGTAAVLSFKPRDPSLPASTAAAATSSTTTNNGSPPGKTTTNSGTTSKRTKVVTGDAISTPYGNAQVRVTIKAGKITNVEALQLQGNDPKSVQISSSAAPQLRAGALARQSAAIDAVSGATITSASYEASLQSALDKAGFKVADGSRAGSRLPQVDEHDGDRRSDRDGGEDDDPPPELFMP